jgi:hypothetical protein
VTITVQLPDAVGSLLFANCQEPTRAVLEAVALEGYRTDRLSEYDVQQLLGFETRMEVHGFLKEHNVYLHYTVDDLEHDMQEARLYSGLKDASHPTEQPAG